MVQIVLSDGEEFILNQRFEVKIPQKCISNPLVCLHLCVRLVYVVSGVFFINWS